MVIKTAVCVIGGGPGGLACVDVLAAHGQEVVLINDGAFMGYGIDGAFASKAEFEITRQYVYASRRPDVFGDVPRPSFEKVVHGTRASADILRRSLSERFARLPGVQLIEGHAEFTDEKVVRVGDDEVHAQNYVIATGSRPRVPADVDVSSARVLTSDTVFELEHCPKSMLVVGGGIIGCEFACIFAALGCRVQLLDTQPHILGSEDEDVSAFMAKAFRSHDIDVVPDSRFDKLVESDDGVVTHLEDGRTFESEVVLFAIGRVPASANLNLEAIGVETNERGLVCTDGNMLTNVENIYAVGDVGQRNSPLDMALVHVAQAEGRCTAHRILNEKFHSRMDHVPYIVFTIPMLAGAGLGERAARERYGDGVRIGKYPHSRNHRAHANSPPIGFTKLIVGPPGDDRILGVRVVGREADTLVAAASIMIERDLPYTYLLDCILPHPSLIECLQGAAHIIGGDTLSYEEGEEYGLDTVAE